MVDKSIASLLSRRAVLRGGAVTGLASAGLVNDARSAEADDRERLAGRHGVAPTTLPIAGLIGNQVSLRSVYPISRYEARDADYVPGSTVLQLADGELHFVAPGSPWDTYRAAGDAEARQVVNADRTWLARGTVPGLTRSEKEMATRALLDMRTLTRPNGAAVVAWYTYWQFVWPRDASWMSAAFSATGHHGEALDVLRFLARAQRDDGVWEARYHPIDATGVQDGRHWQLDANGWVPWAAWLWWTNVDHTAENRRHLEELWPMVRSAADYAARSLDRRGLPPVSPDYWETGTDKPNLGTAAPLLAGLRAASDLAGETGRGRARQWAEAAGGLAEAIDTHFAPRYTRTVDPGSGLDAAVTFLAPPFASFDPAVDAAVQLAGKKLTIPNGGVVPGEAWPGDRTEAWTAETCWFALAAAGAGRRDDTNRWLDWISGHRTDLGVIPEKVDGDGAPASVAPFGWTDAVVLLTLIARDQELPTPPAAGRQ